MLLVIDNYDSFTYNLVQYLEELGATTVVYRNDEITVEDALNMKNLSGILLSPGPGRPEKSGIINELIESAPNDLPIFGVCLGHQALAQVFGGKIGYAPVLMHGKTSEINHDGSSIFSSVTSPFTATRYHSLTVEPKSLPSVFKKTAWTDDGVIMGIEHKNRPLFGVQFHPESIMTPDGKTILKNFLDKLK